MIKASFRLIFAALAATAALAACTKEPTPGATDQTPASPQAEGSRVIAVSFGPQTKTRLEDGLQPKFVNGKDTILLYAIPEDENEPLLTDICVVAVDENDNATISTNLTGPLVAVYPAKFAESDGDITLPSVQSGKFSDANICAAKMEGEDESSLHFENCFAILKFYVDESIGVKSITIKSSSDRIADNSYTITVKAPEGKTLADVTDDPGKRICYVALNGHDGGLSSQLTFESETKSQGTVTRTPTHSVNLHNGYMYNAFIPYYIEVNVGTDLAPIYQKWAYCNIGAFLPEEAGDYFSWAEVAGHTPAGKVFTFPDSNPDADRYTGSWAASSGFAVCNTPYYANDSYGKYNDIDKLTGLAAGDDAASVNWGNGWKMPTATDAETLAAAKGEWDDSKKGYFFGTESNTVFFPVTGYGNGNALENKTQFGAYWSSSVSSGGTFDPTKNAVCLILKNPNANAIVPNAFETLGAPEDSGILTEDAERRYGLAVRPICDPAPIPTEHEYVEIGGLKWATCNIGAANPTDYGWYFSWGNTEGYIHDDVKKWVMASDSTTTLGLDGKFNSTNYNNTPGKDVSEDISPTSVNDAARINWGGDWRMPTKGDFAALAADGVWIWTTGYNSTRKFGYIVYVSKDDADKGKAVMKGTLMKWNGSSYDAESGALQCSYSETTDTHLFFPVAGCGLGTTPYDAGARGYYLSSSWIGSSEAYGLFFDSDGVKLTNFARYNGFSVRPVSD